MKDSTNLNEEGTTHKDAIENFSVEISDLPPVEHRHFLMLKLVTWQMHIRALIVRLGHASTQRGNEKRPYLVRKQYRAKIGKVLTTLGIGAALVLLLFGNIPDLRVYLVTMFESRLSASPTKAPGPVSEGTGRVPVIVEQSSDSVNTSTMQGSPGPLPSTCPQANTLQFFMTPLDPPGLGGGPLWLTGFNGPTAALVHWQPLETPMSQPPGTFSSWYTTLTVFIQKGFSGTIVLHGTNQIMDSRGELEFGYADSLSFAPAMNLSLSNSAGLHFINSGPWEMTSIRMLLPSSGCYTLQANWLASSWTRYFAAGR